jgi:hypothetical protein
MPEMAIAAMPITMFRSVHGPVPAMHVAMGIMMARTGEAVLVKAVTGVVVMAEGAVNNAVKATMATAKSASGSVDLRQGETEEDSRRRGDEFS